METPATFLFFGRPGAGKSFQFELLVEHLRKREERRIFPLAWSRVRDEFMRSNSDVQGRIEENHATGKVQPAFLSVSLWGPALLGKFKGDEHLLVEGLPRQRSEAEMFESLLEFYDRDCIEIIHLDVPEAVAHDRLVKRNETQDQSKEAIRERLAWYASDTLPLLDFFKTLPRYRLTTIDGTQSPENIFASILEKVTT